MSIKRGSISAVRSNHSENTPDLSLIYESCHSQKSINRALILLEKGPKLEGKRRRREGREGRDSSSTTVGVRQATARRRNFAGLPPGLQATPEFRPAYNCDRALAYLSRPFAAIPYLRRRFWPPLPLSFISDEYQKSKKLDYGSTRMQDMFTDIRKCDERPLWIGESVWAEFNSHYRKTAYFWRNFRRKQI
ncbi:hypothetical protein M5K25_007632 [Dendrobium thyrsiflorum]|uniref:Uncharacterized protein n=1 Tax=Dendrobium thyrsiflorum TaxID=117978 RepID=A0ABD0VFT7_DENTH